jgi:hypothetical protein
MAEQFNSVDTQLGTLLDGLDETALAPDARIRALTARQAARNAASRAALIEEVKQELAPAQQEPVQNAPQPDVGAMIEAEMVQLIQASDLEDDDDRFNWDEAQGILSKQGVAGVRLHFMQKIAEIKAEDGASDRREGRRERAGVGSPSGAGGNRTPEEVIEAAANGEDIPVADRMAALQAMGVEFG